MKKKYLLGTILLLASLVFAIGLFTKDASKDDQKIASSKDLGRLLEVGSNSCASCQAMNKVLEELKLNHPSRVRIEKIDIFKQKEAMSSLDVRVIPTQIFYDKNEKEIFRHEGYFSLTEILTKLDELGI